MERYGECLLIFYELKKKYEDVVYKRRLPMYELEAMDWLCGGDSSEKNTQIASEIDYFLRYYQNLRPTVFLSYEREAFYCRAGGNLRVTFDENILVRQEEMSLESGVWGVPILEEGRVLMEIKTCGGIPLWMTHFLTQERIFKTSFSKYGTAYKNLIFPKLKGDNIYV